ncbi:MAG: SMP-30/gluconolactonase/LRE family protein [Vicinamibacterales bacterium]
MTSRRAFLHSALAASGAAAARAAVAAGQTLPVPPPVTRDWDPARPVRYPDPDVVALDPRFRPYILGNTPLLRLHTGTLWAEGPAWNGVGRFLVWSDIPNDVQLRWLADDGRVTVFRRPSGHSNGNTFDREGRQLSCEHGGRRVVRYEHDGRVTVVADRFQGRRLNSPNDVAVHADGSIWFTDPLYGIRGNYEGDRAESEVTPGVYRVDPQTGGIALVTDQLSGPNGLCFSPDYRRLYVADTGSGRDIRVLDVDGASARNLRRHAVLSVPGTSDPSGADGIRCDVDGNIWAGARPGVQVIAPDGAAIGMIRLPENCANVAFGGPKRNRLFMTASQSLYAVYVNTQGAGHA